MCLEWDNPDRVGAIDCFERIVRSRCVSLFHSFCTCTHVYDFCSYFHRNFLVGTVPGILNNVRSCLLMRNDSFETNCFSMCSTNCCKNVTRCAAPPVTVSTRVPVTIVANSTSSIVSVAMQTPESAMIGVWIAIGVVCGVVCTGAVFGAIVLLMRRRSRQPAREASSVSMSSARTDTYGVLPTSPTAPPIYDVGDLQPN